jgi:hypothetical protein
MGVTTLERRDPEPEPDPEQMRILLNVIDKQLALLRQSVFPSGRDQRTHIDHLKDRAVELRAALEQNRQHPSRELHEQIDTLNRNVTAIKKHPPEDIGFLTSWDDGTANNSGDIQ